MRIAYSPDFGAFPVDRGVARVVAEAVKAFEEAGATVEEVSIELDYGQRELSDLWCRLIMPLNIEGLEGLKSQGIDLLGEHRDDFPPEYLRWIDEGYRLSALDVMRDQRMRTHVYDQIQQVMHDHDFLVTPTLAAPPVDNADDGNTIGPRTVEGVEVDPLIGWCLTLPPSLPGCRTVCRSACSSSVAAPQTQTPSRRVGPSSDSVRGTSITPGPPGGLSDSGPSRDPAVACAEIRRKLACGRWTRRWMRGRSRSVSPSVYTYAGSNPAPATQSKRASDLGVCLSGALRALSG